MSNVQESTGQRIIVDPADYIGETVTVIPPRPRGYRGTHRRPSRFQWNVRRRAPYGGAR